MQFLADLDGGTIFLSVLSAVMAVGFLTMLWGSYDNKWPEENTRPLGYLIAFAVVPLFFVYDAYCPDADQPHIRVAGQVVPFKAYTYRKRKSDYTGILGCVGLCGQQMPLLEFDQTARYRLMQTRLSQPLTVVYLGRTDEARVGQGVWYNAHPVVEISDPHDGYRLFYTDTTRHWPQVIVLLGDSCLGMIAFLICIRAGGKKPGPTEGKGDSESGSSDSMPNELTGLGLGK